MAIYENALLREFIDCVCLKKKTSKVDVEKSNKKINHNCNIGGGWGGCGGRN